MRSASFNRWGRSSARTACCSRFTTPASRLARPGAAPQPLIAVLGDASLRSLALRYLLELAPSLAPALAESLRDPSPDVRRIVADVMGFSRDATVVPALQAATKDPDADVVAAAQRAIERIALR